MADYYVPEIQRPGFGYQRRSEDDEEPDEQDAATGGSDVSGAPDSFTPYAQGTPWTGGGDVSAPVSRGGADTAPPSSISAAGTPASGSAVQTPDYWPNDAGWLNNYSSPQQPDLGGTAPLDFGTAPSQQSAAANYPSDAGTPGVYDQPMPRPAPIPPPVSPIKPYTPGPQQQKLKALTEAGPKRSILGTIAGMVAKGAAGYVNAASRTRNPVPVPTQTARDWALRAPGGGSWDTKLARQKELAQEEQGEESRALTSQQVQAQAEERMAMARRDARYGDYLGEQADTNRQYREDQARNTRLQRILQIGGKGGPTETREIPPGGKPPVGPEWYIAPDPLNPGYRIAVRPSRGDEIDAETGKQMHLVPDAEGKFHATPTMISTFQRTKELADAAAARTATAEAERQRREDQHAEDLEVRKARNAVLAGDAQDRKERQAAALRDQEQRTSDAVNQGRTNLLNSAATWKNNELDKLKRDGPALGSTPEQEEANIQREWVRRSQAAYDQWGDAIRRRPGQTAADFKFYPNGSVVQASESYGAGGKPVPVGGGPTPAPTLTTPPASTGGGRGGRGGASLPARVATPQSKTMTRAEVQAYANTTKTDYATAAKVFTDLNYTITP